MSVCERFNARDSLRLAGLLFWYLSTLRPPAPLVSLETGGRARPGISHTTFIILRVHNHKSEIRSQAARRRGGLRIESEIPVRVLSFPFDKNVQLTLVAPHDSAQP